MLDNSVILAGSEKDVRKPSVQVLLDSIDVTRYVKKVSIKLNEKNFVTDKSVSNVATIDFGPTDQFNTDTLSEGQLVQVSLGFDSELVQVFVGHISKINKTKHDTCTVTAKDEMNLFEAKITPQAYENMTVKDLLTAVITDNTSFNSLNFENVTHVVSVFIPEKDSTVLDALDKIRESVAGSLYFDGNGYLNFRSPLAVDHLFGSSVYTFGRTVKNEVTTKSQQYLYKEITIKSKPQSIYPKQKIWIISTEPTTVNSERHTAVNGTFTINVDNLPLISQIDDPQSLTVKDIASGNDLQVNSWGSTTGDVTLEDTTYNGDCRVTYKYYAYKLLAGQERTIKIKFGDRAVEIDSPVLTSTNGTTSVTSWTHTFDDGAITFKNIGTEEDSVAVDSDKNTLFYVEGEPVRDGQEILTDIVDATSPVEKKLSIYNNIISSPSWSKELGDYYEQVWCVEKRALSLRIMGNPLLEIDDTLTVDGIDYLVTEITHNYSSKGFNTSLSLVEKKGFTPTNADGDIYLPTTPPSGVDHTIKVFNSQPVPPYSIGDLWIDNSGDITKVWHCVVSRISGTFVASDWSQAAENNGDGKAPLTPTGLSLSTKYENQKSYVTASWDPNSESDIKGYGLRWSLDGTLWNNIGLGDETYTFEAPRGKTVYVQIQATDLEGYKSPWSASVSIVSGNGTAPATPTGLAVNTHFDTTKSFIDVTWTPNPEADIRGYELIWSYDNTTWQNAGVFGDDSATFEVSSGKLVYVQIRALDFEGFKSGWTLSVSTTSAISTTPAVPTGLNLSTLFSNEISHIAANWNANTEANFKNYELHWSYDNTTWTLLPSTTGTSIVFDVNQNSTVYVQIRALNDQNIYSGWSASVSIISASASTPNAPTGLSYSAGYKLIWLNWVASTSSNIKEYVIQRAVTTSGGSVDQSTLTWNDLITINSTRYTDDNLDGTQYYAYRVAAKNYSGYVSSWAYYASSTAVNPIQPNDNPSQVCNPGEVPSAPANGSLIPGISRVVATWDMIDKPCFSHFVVSYTVTQTYTDSSTQQGTNNITVTTNAWVKTFEPYMTSGVASISIAVKVKTVNLLGNESSELDLGSVTISKTPTGWIEDGAVIEDKIAANAITAGKIAAGTITGDHLNAIVDITTKKLMVNPSTNSKIVIGDVSADTSDFDNGIYISNGSLEIVDPSTGRVYFSPQGIRQMYGFRASAHINNPPNGYVLDEIYIFLPNGATAGTMTLRALMYGDASNGSAKIELYDSGNNLKTIITSSIAIPSGGFKSYDGYSVADGDYIRITITDNGGAYTIGSDIYPYIEYLYA